MSALYYKAGEFKHKHQGPETCFVGIIHHLRTNKRHLIDPASLKHFRPKTVALVAMKSRLIPSRDMKYLTEEQAARLAARYWIDIKI